MNISLTKIDNNITNYNIIHLHTGSRNNRLYATLFNLAKCLYNAIKNFDHTSIKTIIIFDNLKKNFSNKNQGSHFREEIFDIDYMNSYFARYNIVFFAIPEPKRKLDILKIEYGLKSNNIVDITDKINKCSLLTDDYFCIPEDINLNSLCDEDPAFGYQKKLYVHYKIDGEYFLFAEDEYDSKIINKVELDLTKHIEFVSSKIEILKVEYGISPANVIDVTSEISKYFQFKDEHFSISNNINFATLCEDPIHGVPKKLYIDYKINDKKYNISINEHSHKLAHECKICLVPKVKSKSQKLQILKVELEDKLKYLIDITPDIEKYATITEDLFSIREDISFTEIFHIAKDDFDNKLSVNYLVNNNEFIISTNNFNIEFGKNIEIKLINEETNEIQNQSLNKNLFREILNNIKFVSFYNDLATNYIQAFASPVYYNKINVIHLMIESELSPFCDLNKMTLETFKDELNKKYYFLLDKYIKPSPYEMNIILSSEESQKEFAEYLKFRLFNFVFIDRNSQDPENISVLALLVSKSCNNIFIGNNDFSMLKDVTNSYSASNIIPEKTMKILINLNNIREREVLSF